MISRCQSASSGGKPCKYSGFNRSLSELVSRRCGHSPIRHDGRRRRNRSAPPGSCPVPCNAPAAATRPRWHDRHAGLRLPGVAGTSRCIYRLMRHTRRIRHIRAAKRLGILRGPAPDFFQMLLQRLRSDCSCRTSNARKTCVAPPLATPRRRPSMPSPVNHAACAAASGALAPRTYIVRKAVRATVTRRRRGPAYEGIDGRSDESHLLRRQEARQPSRRPEHHALPRLSGTMSRSPTLLSRPADDSRSTAHDPDRHRESPRAHAADAPVSSPPRRSIRTRSCSSAWAISTSCSTTTRARPRACSTSR